MFGRVFLVCCLALSTLGQDAVARGTWVAWAGSLTEGEQEERATARAGVGRSGAAAIPFPWAPPMPGNMGDICRYVGQRRIEPPGAQTDIGFSQRWRQAQALHRMEASFGKCCRGDHIWTGLACAMDGWIWSLQQYCQKEIDGKNSIHKCCKMQWKRRYDCFIRESHGRGYALQLTSTATAFPDHDSSPDQTIQLLHKLF